MKSLITTVGRCRDRHVDVIRDVSDRAHVASRGKYHRRYYDELLQAQLIMAAFDACACCM